MVLGYCTLIFLHQLQLASRNMAEKVMKNKTANSQPFAVSLTTLKFRNLNILKCQVYTDNSLTTTAF